MKWPAGWRLRLALWLSGGREPLARLRLMEQRHGAEVSGLLTSIAELHDQHAEAMASVVAERDECRREAESLDSALRSMTAQRDEERRLGNAAWQRLAREQADRSTGDTNAAV